MRSPAGSRRSPPTSRSRRPARPVPQVRLWQRIEIETAAELPTFFDELVAAGVDVLPAAEQRRLERASESAKIAVELYATWLEGTLADGTDDWAIGRERHDELVGLRAFDGLDADAILALGWERLERGTCGTRRGRPRDRPRRRRGDRHRPGQVRPAGRLRGRPRGVPRRDAPGPPPPHRARPRDGPRRRADRRHRRRPSTCATSCRSRPTSSRPPSTATRRASTSSRPSVDGDPNAMREHNFASISNTSIHEAYPGHHLQLDTARRQPSLTRLLADAPEFVEGWGMYSELMMREQGFDDGPAFRRDHAHRRDLAGLPDHPRRPDAPRRDQRRGGDRLPRRAHELRAPERPRRGPLVHLPPDLPAVVPAGPDAAARPARRRAAPARRRGSASRASTTRCCATARCRSASTAACSRPRA